MQLTSKLSSLVMVAAFATISMAPLSLAAQDRKDHRTTQEHRYYDPVHKDYHAWSDDEDRQYHAYLDEHHMKYRDFSRLSKKQQREYWQWRHDHEEHR